MDLTSCYTVLSLVVNENGVIVPKLNPDVVRPLLDTDGETAPMTITSDTASFAVGNVKKGLWYSVVSSDDVAAENYDYPTTAQKTNAGKQATTTDNLSLFIPLPDSNVQFYRVAADDVEPTWRQAN